VPLLTIMPMQLTGHGLEELGTYLQFRGTRDWRGAATRFRIDRKTFWNAIRVSRRPFAIPFRAVPCVHDRHCIRMLLFSMHLGGGTPGPFRKKRDSDILRSAKRGISGAGFAVRRTGDVSASREYPRVRRMRIIQMEVCRICLLSRDCMRRIVWMATLTNRTAL